MQHVLIEYQNCHQTLDVYLIFDNLDGAKFKPNPNEIFLQCKNIMAWVRFEFLGNQAFIRGCRGEAPDRVSE